MGEASPVSALAVKNARTAFQMSPWSPTTEWPTGYPPSKLTITLTKKSGATELKMVHSKVPPEQSEDYAEGWRTYYWQPLAGFFAKK